LATLTYTPIASITLGSSASSVEFSSIPQNFRDLVLVGNINSDTSTNINVRVNSDASALYEQVVMLGRGTSFDSFSTSNTGTLTAFQGNYGISNGLNVFINMQLFDYSQTDKNKSVLFRFNSFDADGALATAGRYASNDAVTSLEISANSMPAGSTFALYGIEA